MPKAWTKKDERQYRAILKQCSRSKRGVKLCKRIAAATVNKQRAIEGRTLAGGPSRIRKREASLPRTMRQVIETNKACGRHFFDPATIKFFDSKIYPELYPSLTARASYFVTSERGPSKVRKFTVRQARGCEVSTVGQFQGYDTKEAAVRAAKDLARKR